MPFYFIKILIDFKKFKFFIGVFGLVIISINVDNSPFNIENVFFITIDVNKIDSHYSTKSNIYGFNINYKEFLFGKIKIVDKHRPNEDKDVIYRGKKYTILFYDRWKYYSRLKFMAINKSKTTSYSVIDHENTNEFDNTPFRPLRWDVNYQPTSNEIIENYLNSVNLKLFLIKDLEEMLKLTSKH